MLTTPDRKRMSDAELGPRRVLIVDDEHTILDAVREYLAAYGLVVDAAHEREEAEALLLTRGYDVVIADMRLTGIHGREGLELLRFAREHRPMVRLIVLTAHGSRELEDEARRCGADEFLEKPVPLSELARQAFKLLGRESLEHFWSRRGA
jgi:DNA-binding response OmpR family regulator